MRSHLLRLVCSSLVVAGFAACGEDEEKEPPCDAVADTGCAPGLTCEWATDGSTLCAAPVVLRGQVVDLADESPVEGARVVALDVNGAPLATVAVTDEDGNYEMPVPHERQRDGSPVGVALTLRVDASGFQTFPSGIRQALPIDTTAAADDEGKLVVESALTEVGLIELPDAVGLGSLSGTVSLPERRPGVLVVAERNGVGVSGIADRDGSYRIFNLPAADYEVTGYTRGVSFEARTATVAEGADTVLDLARSEAATARLSGKVSIVNPGDGNATSIILVLESLFDEATLRGESPPGLRAPNPGLAPDVTGAFSIDGIPAGRYVVLAGFENDRLVRDPDTSIGGTAIVRQELGAGADVALPESFKITGALAFLPPLGFEPVGVTAAPTISWEDDSSEDAYEVRVFDALGDEVWTHTEPGHSGSTPAVTYGGPLDPGMYYQVKVRSLKDDRGTMVPISQTEDLAGVFFAE
ncbi:carboxypeptidase-like regulatory domain-containing protein [Vulgatibacter sp.]|uniref:carboxypeptidase-like regulatory domain-containing protein n=1 Tax=Vulgatibacter sp. TaxID=1971226 RepID=UPI00356AA9A1